ncbi:MAG: hypothetical protein F6J98_28150, partial [Moorea sp. SIO4G2]|nr:hypothetical protein [Moorena sp. SIO4G2]
MVSSSVATNPLYPLDANMVNVRDYGAKGDGITDDTVAIRLAVQDNLTKHYTLFQQEPIWLVIQLSGRIRSVCLGISDLA